MVRIEDASQSLSTHVSVYLRGCKVGVAQELLDRSQIGPPVEQVGGERGEALSLGDTVADQTEGPVAAYEVEETRQILANAINRMPEREKIVLTLYYYEGLTLAEIGQVLGVTESRVCQIHTKAIFQLRSRLSEPLPERGLIT